MGRFMRGLMRYFMNSFRHGYPLTSGYDSMAAMIGDFTAALQLD
jgi:hypothetical protein